MITGPFDREEECNPNHLNDVSEAIGKAIDPYDQTEPETSLWICEGCDYYDADWCESCQGEGRVPTEDFESYLGAMYKTCPICHGAPGDGPLS